MFKRIRRINGSNQRYDMNYELAKKLKEMGFKYRQELHRAFKKDGTFRTVGDPEDEGYVLEQTLNELIEACGKESHTEDWGEFYLLADGEKWQAGYVDTTVWENPFYTVKKVYGSTKEEAVALLWLELHNK